MWFWLVVIILVIGIVATIVGNYVFENTEYDTEWLFIIGISISIFFALVLIVMGYFIIDGHTNLDAKISEKEQVYESLVYQLENNLYDNDNDIGKKELYNEIKEWNTDLAYKHLGRKMFIDNGIPGLFE